MGEIARLPQDPTSVLEEAVTYAHKNPGTIYGAVVITVDADDRIRFVGRGGYKRSTVLWALKMLELELTHDIDDIFKDAG